MSIQRSAAPQSPAESHPLFPPGVLMTIGAIVVIIAALLSGAALSGLLVGNGLAGPDRALPNVLIQWPGHAGDPAAAWTRDPRPGPAWLIYTIAAVFILTAGFAWWVVSQRLNERKLRTAGHTPGLATTRDVAGIIDADGARAHAVKLRAANGGNTDDDPTELVTPLGVNTADGQEIALRPNDSLLVLGASGQGKTWRTAVPQILFAPGPVAVTSTKADVLRATVLPRKRKGKVMVFDPENIAKGWPERSGWSPIAGADDPDAAIRRAAGLVAGRPMSKGGDSDAAAFYATRAEIVIQCYLHAAALDGRTMSEVRRWSTIAQNNEVLRILQRNHSDFANDFVQATMSEDPKVTANTMSTVTNILKPLSSPKLMAAVNVSAAESLDVAAYIRDANSLYMLSSGKGQSMAPFVSALASEVAYEAHTRSEQSPAGRLDPYMRMVLDEVANVAPIPDLPEMLTDSGGRGISIMALAHGPDQLRSRFGAIGARQLIDSASGQLVLPGLMAYETLDEISKLLGTIEVTIPTKVGANQWRDERITKPVMSAQEIRTMGEGEALLVFRNMPGIKLRLKAWFDGDQRQSALIEPSQEFYDKAVATGVVPEITAPVFDQRTGVEAGPVEAGPLEVVDFTKGWGKK